MSSWIFLMTVTLSGCRMRDRYWYTHPSGPDPGGSDPGWYPGRYHGGVGNPEEGLWQPLYGPSRDPFSWQLGLLIPSEGGRSSSWAVSGSLQAPGSLTPSERGRSNPWARGDPGVTASRTGGAGPWTSYEARSGSAYSAQGVAPMDPDDPMMSCLPSGRSSTGVESLPRTQSHGSSGMVSSFDPLARAADLLNTNFWMARAEWRFQRLGTSVTSCWKPSCSVCLNWSPSGPVRTTSLGGRSLWGGRRDLCQDIRPLFWTQGEGGLSWELDLHGRNRQGGPPSPTSPQTLGCPLSFLRGVSGHQFLTRAQKVSSHLSPTPVEGANSLLAS